MREATVVVALLALASSVCALRPLKTIEFGHGMLPEFQLDEGYKSFNHGSFGATPRVVIEAVRQLQDRMEARPDPWFREVYRNEMRVVRARLAAYVNASVDDLVIVESASSAVNAVARSMGLVAGDKVIYFSIAYPMVKNVFSFLRELDGIDFVEQKIKLPIRSPNELVDALQAALEANPGTKLVSVCHISSTPAVIHPVKELAAVAHAHGARILVDGAHALGHLPLDFDDLGVDYYLGNAHKWLFGPKGTAILWVAPAWQAEVRPTVISSEYKDSTFISRFEYTGTRDYSNMLALGATLDLRAALGDDAIMGYSRNLSLWAADYLTRLWGTDLIAPREMIGAMVDIRLPLATIDDANSMRATLYDEHGIYMVVHEQNGVPYTRLSAQIYMEQSDFEQLGALILDYAAASARPRAKHLVEQMRFY